MNQRNRESTFCFFCFFNVTFFIPLSKKGNRIHAATSIDKVCGHRSFQPLVDCHNSVTDPANRLITDLLSGRVVHFHDRLEGRKRGDGLREGGNRLQGILPGADSVGHKTPRDTDTTCVPGAMRSRGGG